MKLFCNLADQPLFVSGCFFPLMSCDARSEGLGCDCRGSAP